ncbi:hypothetical protein [Streptomyces sp. NPDC020917]|uniref:hypothetical protein n=1 Tax=Streptomyces sp. NPDC020917 TaxID=3365102 RepID=UPI0037A97676
MTLCDYFSAADDEAAVAVMDTLGGPIPAGLDAISLKNIDPVVVIGRLETLMTGHGDGETGGSPPEAQLVSTPDGEGPLVFRLSDALTAALAVAGPGDLARAARPWSLTAELRQFQVDEATAVDVLDALAALARRARSGGLRVYCWWSL